MPRQQYKCTFYTPTNKYQRSFRRYSHDASSCTCKMGYANASTFIEIVETEIQPATTSIVDKNDARWPNGCACGCEFNENDPYQDRYERIYICKENGHESTLNDLPFGAMYYADWELEYDVCGTGPDGHILYIKVPGGIWRPDSQASNCTRKDDNIHKCWVRHGVPPLITINKAGDTCAAGAGSIMNNEFHGMLTNGLLYEV